mmetsp:Transcript_13523/g.45820  ORF Transcript_13523/g.45820 Transcript_13523/m.45820 type:complete len:340 (-) Transcript_13523:10-1029(-)
MHYPTAALALGQARLRGVLWQHARGAVVEAGAHGEDEVRLLDGVVGVGRAVHAQHVQRQGIVLVKHAHRVERGRDRDVGLPGEGPQGLCAVDGPLARVDDGPLRAVHQGGDGREVGRVDGLGRRRRSDGERFAFQHGDHHVLGQVQVHGALLAAGGHTEGLVHYGPDLLHGAHLVGPLAAGPREVHRRALLKGIGTHRGGGHLAAEGHHGHAVALGILQRRDNVGQAGPGGGQDDAGPARGLGVPLRRVPAALLAPVHHEADGRRVESVQHREVGAAGIAKHVLDAVLHEGVVEHLPTEDRRGLGRAVGESGEVPAGRGAGQGRSRRPARSVAPADHHG